MAKIQLKSNDDEIFEVDRDVIRLSTTLNTMFQDLGMDGPEAEVMNIQLFEFCFYKMNLGAYWSHSTGKCQWDHFEKGCLFRLFQI